MKFVFLPAFTCSILLLAGCSGESSDERMLQAVAAAKQGDWPKASKIANEVSESSPNAVAPMLLQALAYEKSGELNKAIDLVQQCAENNPQDFTTLYTLGRLYSKDPKRQDKAYVTLTKALALRKGDVNTLILLCNVGIKNNEPDTKQYLEQLLKRSDLSNADCCKAYYLYAVCLKNENKYSDADKAILKAERYSSKADPELLFYIAMFYEENSNGFKAKSLYQKFENSQGGDPELKKEAKKRRLAIKNEP